MEPPTPLVRLRPLDADLYAKVEYLHPSASIKHRALPAFLAAEMEAGSIARGQRIVIQTAGSAGMAVAWSAAVLGLRATVVVPEVATLQVVRTIRWLGAECHQLADDEMAVMMRRLAVEPRVRVLDQASEARLIDYYRPIAAEILADCPSATAITVGIGSGLSLTGIGRELKARGGSCRVVGVEPAEAAVASGKPWAPHSLIGLAPPIPQPLLDRSVLSEIVTVASRDAWQCARDVYRRAGLPVGPSAGAAIRAAMMLRERGVEGPLVAVCASSISEFIERAPTLAS
jgi:cysteine synthase A